MRLTLFTDYSLRVLMVLATRTDSLVTIGELTQAFGISQAHLMKVTHILGKTRWVETARGRNGGMRLAMHPSKIRIGEVVRELESDFAVVECFGPQNECVLTGGCELASVLARATGAFLEELDRFSLADVAASSAALSALPMWQPLTWSAPLRAPTLDVVPGRTGEMLRTPARKASKPAKAPATAPRGGRKPAG